MDARPHATILINTKDRKDELAKALESVLQQRGQYEVLVFDDGSSDGTAEMIRERFPTVRVERSESPLGIVPARNRAIPMAAAPIVVVVDDDCILSDLETVAITLSEFDRPEIGAVAIPHRDVLVDPAVRSAAPDRDQVYLGASFRGCAHAVRVEAFQRAGGYREVLWRQGEESDLCLRMLDAGYVTRVGTAPPIDHYESPHRDKPAISFYTIRNGLLLTWLNTPLPWLVPALVANAWGTGRAAWRRRHPGQIPRGLAAALRLILGGSERRRPVSGPAFRTFRRLRRARKPLAYSTTRSSLFANSPDVVSSPPS